MGLSVSKDMFRKSENDITQKSRDVVNQKAIYTSSTVWSLEYKGPIFQYTSSRILSAFSVRLCLFGKCLKKKNNLRKAENCSLYLSLQNAREQIWQRSCLHSWLQSVLLLAFSEALFSGLPSSQAAAPVTDRPAACLRR